MRIKEYAGRECGKSRNKRRRETERECVCMCVCICAWRYAPWLPITHFHVSHSLVLVTEMNARYIRGAVVGSAESLVQTRSEINEGGRGGDMKKERTSFADREWVREGVAVSERCRSLWCSPTVILRVTSPRLRERTNGNAPSRPADVCGSVQVHTQLRRTRTHTCHRSRIVRGGWSCMPRHP